jgi:hypothetical protein
MSLVFIRRGSVASPLLWALLLLCAAFCTESSADQQGRQRLGLGEPWCAVHVKGYSTDQHIAVLISNLPALAGMGINTIILQVDYGFAFESYPELQSRQNPITKTGAQLLFETCNEFGIRLIPLFQCLSHQSAKAKTCPLLEEFPEFDITPGAFPGNEGLFCREWDPLHPNVNQVVFSLIDELIDAFQAQFIHVGLDEVFLIGSENSTGTSGLNPAVVFAQAVNDMHQHIVGERKIQMLMWGDRLLNAREMTYGKWESAYTQTCDAVNMIPKDIIICDWHYSQRESYPSVPFFINKGFRVLPSSWKDVDATLTFVHYANQQASASILGHLFTTWLVKRAVLVHFPSLVEGVAVFKQLNTEPEI